MKTPLGLPKKTASQSIGDRLAVDFIDAFPSSQDDRQLTEEELIRAVRLSIAAEHEATQLYQQIANATDNATAKKVMNSIADEEIVHVGEFTHLLKKIAPDEEGLYEDGEQEAQKLSHRQKTAAPIDEDFVRKEQKWDYEVERREQDRAREDWARDELRRDYIQQMRLGDAQVDLQNIIDSIGMLEQEGIDPFPGTNLGEDWQEWAVALEQALVALKNMERST